MGAVKRRALYWLGFRPSTASSPERRGRRLAEFLPTQPLAPLRFLSTTRAADRLGLTQSAVSRLLGRLRTTFGDPLFVRTSRGLTPTSRALALTGPLRQTMMELERFLVERPGFDPGYARRR